GLPEIEDVVPVYVPVLYPVRIAGVGGRKHHQVAEILPAQHLGQMSRPNAAVEADAVDLLTLFGDADQLRRTEPGVCIAVHVDGKTGHNEGVADRAYPPGHREYPLKIGKGL